VSDYVAFLKNTVAAADKAGEAPILNFGELARNGLDMVTFVARVDPACAVIRRKETVKTAHADYPELPPGAVAVTVWIVGRDSERLTAEWDFFTAEKFMNSTKQTLYQVIRCAGSKPQYAKTAMRGADGVVIRESEISSS